MMITGVWRLRSIFTLIYILIGCHSEAPPNVIAGSTAERGTSGGVEVNAEDSPRISSRRIYQPVERVRILTTQSVSVVAWSEVEVLGAPIDDPNSVRNLSREVVTSASSFITARSPNWAVDGQELSMWNAGVSAPAWIELDLGGPYLIHEVRLQVAQDQPGVTTHELQVGGPDGSLQSVHRFMGDTQHGQWLTFQVNPERHDMTTGGNMEDSAGDLAEDRAGDSAGGSAGEIADLSGPTIGKWRRVVLSFSSSTYTGNPSLVEMSARFTHQDSGQELTLPAYYDGEDTWRVGFMPTEVGLWSWSTTSDDSDLDRQTGELTALASSHQGLLTADPNAPNKWRYLDGGPVIPIGLFANVMLDDASDVEFERLANFMSDHRFTLINSRLSENDLAFANVDELRLDLALWRRLEARLEALTERGLGVDLMLYTDDSGRPSFAGQSDAERLLIRTMVARLSGFPMVIFNTGIDLVEYRDQAWVNWFGAQLRELDPYQHPISSRYGGGSGQLVMEDQTFNSVGARNSTMSDLVSAYRRDDLIPALNNDNWSEDLEGLNGHTPSDLRRAAWKAVVAGGVGFSIRHNVLYCPREITECDRYFPIAQVPELLDSAVWISYVASFIEVHLGEAYQSMHPAPVLVDAQGAKFALADDRRDQILILTLGIEDTWDRGDGGMISLRLSGVRGRFEGSWLDPRTGRLSPAGTWMGDQVHSILPPSEEDWILWLTRSN